MRRQQSTGEMELGDQVSVLLYESHPAETRLTVYRLLYILQSVGKVKARRVIMRPVGRSCHVGSKLFGRMRAFKRDVLRIQPFVCNEIAREHSSDIKESFPRSSGHSTSLIRRSTAGQVLAHDEK